MVCILKNKSPSRSKIYLQTAVTALADARHPRTPAFRRRAPVAGCRHASMAG